MYYILRKYFMCLRGQREEDRERDGERERTERERGEELSARQAETK